MKNRYGILVVAAALFISANARAQDAGYNKLKEQAKQLFITQIVDAINNYDSILKDEAALNACVGMFSGGKFREDVSIENLRTCKNELVRVLEANPADSNDKKTNSAVTISNLNISDTVLNVTPEQYGGKSEPQKKDLETKVVKNPLFGKAIPNIRTPEQKRKRLAAVGKHSSTALVKKLQGGKRKTSAPF